mmetsp:Transcript_38934/g.64864  ORF Transcript_38934/g.64864 Transcript_38934/m.64864 type:complete len:299 (+) Transcript_38934:228-1124(+)
MSSVRAEEASVEEHHDVETPRRTCSIKLASGALKRTAIWTSLYQKQFGEESDVERSENDTEKCAPTDSDQLVPVPWIASMSVVDLPTNSAVEPSPRDFVLSPASNIAMSPNNSFLDVESIVEPPYTEATSISRMISTPVLAPGYCARPCTPVDKSEVPSVWEIAPAQLRYALESVLSNESYRTSSPRTAERSDCSPSSSSECTPCCLQSPKPRLWVDPPSTPRRVVLGGGSGSAAATPRTPKRPAPVSQRDFVSTAASASDLLPRPVLSSLSVPATFPEEVLPAALSPAKMPRVEQDR